MPKFEESPRAESHEIIELRREFAQELKKPQQGSHLKKLRRIAGAFALAGVTLFSPQKSIAPELSPEFLGTGKITSKEKSGALPQELYQRILKSLKERGGVEISPQVPETTFKVLPFKVREIAMDQSLREGGPYFSKPEVIFGEKFIKENPELAEKYMEKIKKIMRATVFVEQNDKQWASGVAVNTKRGPVFLTNAHVADNQDIFKVGSIKGLSVYARPVFVDERKDLAVLDMKYFADHPQARDKKQTAERITEFFKFLEIEPLDIEQENETPMKKGEKIAMIGHPLNFPYEVATSEFYKLEKPAEGAVHYEKADFEALVSTSDSRFRVLEMYQYQTTGGSTTPKGVTLPGMSGSPLIRLEGEKGEVKLSALHAFGYMRKTKDKLYEKTNGSIQAKDIREFIQRYETQKPSDLEY